MIETRSCTCWRLSRFCSDIQSVQQALDATQPGTCAFYPIALQLYWVWLLYFYTALAREKIYYERVDDSSAVDYAPLLRHGYVELADDGLDSRRAKRSRCDFYCSPRVGGRHGGSK